MALWVSLKRGGTWVDVYYKGEKICTIKVSEQNRSTRSVIDLDGLPDTNFKVVKSLTNEIKPELIDDSYFNKEVFNK